MVVPAPLVQIMDKSSLDLPSAADNATQQLLMNYCFGHRKANILLCPTTHATLINHDAQRANVRIRWAKTEEGMENFRLGDLENLGKRGDGANTKLMFEYVATKDIKKGSEIYLDYGREWEQAFREHHRTWSPPSGDTLPSLHTVNSMDTPLMPTGSGDARFSYECKVEPYAREDLPFALELEDYRSNPVVDMEHWTEYMKVILGDNTNVCWYPCELSAEVDSEQSTYGVEVYSKFADPPKKIRRIQNMPRDRIRFAEAAYQSNQHLPSSFRHYIPVPDAMLPLRWRTDYMKSDSLRLGLLDAGLDMDLEDRMAAHELTVREAKCGVYFAPSNIPNAGFGTYTAVPLAGKGLVVVSS